MDERMDMKRLFRSACCAAICALSAYSCASEPVGLRLMTYNVRNGVGIDGVQHLDSVAGVIGRVAPDVVALQEVDSVTERMRGRYIPGELAALTGMHATFCRAIDFEGGAYGIGMLSRRRPLDVRRFPLPGREEARALLVARFADYTVCVTHLSLTPEDRLASLGIIRAVTDTCRMPVLLAGDFNMEDAREVLDGLGATFRMLSDTTLLTFPSDVPAVRIDYVLGRGLPASAVVDAGGTECTTASDHRPLWVSLRWR